MTICWHCLWKDHGSFKRMPCWRKYVNGEVNTLALPSDFSVYFPCKDELWPATLTPSATAASAVMCCILLGPVSLNKTFLSKADFCSHILTQPGKSH